MDVKRYSYVAEKINQLTEYINNCDIMKAAIQSLVDEKKLTKDFGDKWKFTVDIDVEVFQFEKELYTDELLEMLHETDD